MAQKPLSVAEMQEAMNAYAKTGNKTEAAKLLGINPNTYTNRIRVAKSNGIQPTIKVANKELTELLEAKDQIRQLESMLNGQEEEKLTSDYIKKVILKMSTAKLSIPNWLIKPVKGKTVAGIPTLFASDWHWGEVVDPNQINGVNEYNVAIGQDRAKVMIEKTIDLLKNHVAHSNYEGIVFVLGGDMVSGDIHEELMAQTRPENQRI